MTDNKLMENLIRTLQYEHRTYERILEIAEKKTDCLIKGDTAALSDINEEESRLAEQTRQLSQVREQLLGKICQELGQDYKTFTIDQLKGFAGEASRKMLEDLKRKLADTVARLSARNGINQKLIENAIKYINFSIELIASPQPAAPIYGKTGHEVAHTAKRSMLDIKY